VVGRKVSEIIGDRYRMYIDESGDHVFNHMHVPSHRYLCLLGCWLSDNEYVKFHDILTSFKKTFVPHHPDNPPILHREDIINRRGHFSCLVDPEKADVFDRALLLIIEKIDFKIVGVVIDKLSLQQKYGDAAAHPYHLALGFLMQRYCGFLNHINRQGDIMAESRGTREDQLLMDSYSRVYSQGVWTVSASVFQQALTTTKLKVKKKSANISGLQLADLLCHPVRQIIMQENGCVLTEFSAFVKKLHPILKNKYNHQLYSGEIEGYGKVFFPK
jgi:hypothetical protein